MILTTRRQHRVLAAMHSSLQKSDPCLVAAFAAFARSSAGAAIPAIERVRARPPRWLAAALRVVAAFWARARRRGAPARWQRGTPRGRLQGALFIPVAAAAMLAVVLLLARGGPQARCAPLHAAASSARPGSGPLLPAPPACPPGQTLAPGH